MSILSERIRYEFGRVGPLRAVPGIGNKGPIETYIEKKRDQSARGGLETEIDFGSRTLQLTTLIDTLAWLAGRKWEPLRQLIAKGLGDSLFDSQGELNDAVWVEKRSSLGPFLLGKLVQECLRNERSLKTKNTEPWGLFEHGGSPRKQRWNALKDAGLALLSGTIGAGAELVHLAIQPTTQEMIPNPAVAATQNGAAAVGLMAGAAVGGAVDVIKGKNLEKWQQIIIPLITGALGLAAGNKVGELIAEKLPQLVEQTHVPLQEQWPLAVIAGLVSAGLITTPTIIRDIKSHRVVQRQLEHMGNWRSLVAVLMNSLEYMRELNSYYEGRKDVLLTPEQIEEQTERKIQITDFLNNRVPGLQAAAYSFNNRRPDKVEALGAYSPDNLLGLAEHVLLAETFAGYMGVARRSKKGGIAAHIEGLLPSPEVLFADVDTHVLNLGAGTANLVKLLKVKGDHIGALAQISPTLAMNMIGTQLEQDPGARDDTAHYGFLGWNLGCRGLFPTLLRGTLAQLKAVPDSKRAIMLESIDSLGKAYEHFSPIGGLDRIFQPPAFVTLLQLYSVVYIKSGETTHGVNGDSGIPGSKGLIGDVGEAVLKAMETNPLIGYMVLADMNIALRYADVLLQNLPQADRNTIKNGLVSIQREIAEQILQKNIPSTKVELRNFMTDSETALNAYLALTMLSEVCDQRVVGPIISRKTQSLSPIFRQSDLSPDTNSVVDTERTRPKAILISGVVGDPLMYVMDLIDFLYNSRRHEDSLIHRQLVEVLGRGLIPILTQEFIRRIAPSGNSFPFTQDVAARATEFIIESMRALDDDLVSIYVRQLIGVVDATVLIAQGNISVLAQVGSIPPQVQSLAAESYLKATTLLKICADIYREKRNILHQKQIEGKPLDEVFEEKIKVLGSAIAKATTSTVHFDA